MNASNTARLGIFFQDVNVGESPVEGRRELGSGLGRTPAEGPARKMLSPNRSFAFPSPTCAQGPAPANSPRLQASRSLNDRKVFDGIVRYLQGDTAFASRGRGIYRSDDAGKSWGLIARLPRQGPSALAARSRLLHRLLRAGVHHVLPVDAGTLVVFAFGRIYRVDLEQGTALAVATVSGSRPLIPCVWEGRVWYGEYLSNPERTPIRIWCGHDGGRRWEPAYTFENVRHVHGVFRDPYSEDLWVTTGDEDGESALWRTEDEFETVEKVLGGSQQTRVVQLLFTSRSLFFGSDTPTEHNYIYRLDRKSGRAEPVQRVESSVFYGCSVGGGLFLSTACEPSPFNATDRAVVWGGGEERSWERCLIFKKDFWPSRLFQYGQVQFPAGGGDGEALWLSPFATEHDQVTFRFPLDEFSEAVP